MSDVREGEELGHRHGPACIKKRRQIVETEREDRICGAPKTETVPPAAERDRQI